MTMLVSNVARTAKRETARTLSALPRRLSSTTAPVVSADASAKLARDGFVAVGKVLSDDEVQRARGRFEDLFKGNFDTGIYPDEWHWREGISKPDAFREIVNGWKADSQIAGVVRSPTLGKLATELMGWPHGARLAQDDVLWKPPLAGGVAFHQDSAYISAQFKPYENNSVTIWIALDDADQDTGVVEYCVGSHLWPNNKAKETTASGSAFHGQAHHLGPLAQAARSAGVSDADIEIQRITVRTGEAIVHHQDVWHGSAASVSSTRHRRALGVHLVRSDVTWRDTRRPDYIYGRYYLPQEASPRDEFFPQTYTP
ncbi:Phytanoyl-CoA dioxygenase domain-containing protein 1-like [Hondaea fermentalgiana]|uniref:Phytanoyl-CoA dioxygenase domain-containing protein 1-like n=1 Tax=Hondaea fermentalgiana TaxID=2315210 RepID=A0A2R5GIF2_9STRA|nr:Phytanoyl-CoA dioxygenase domain-containing protein 1-like [Hondaea fermentalgiana]|eukprot:GBG30672.1 Phytanoyl-CoA dioxygenase domain-containing protein 1-like [Hondaea fermentalgiana]